MKIWTVDGKDHVIKYTINTLVEMEEKLGENPLSVVTQKEGLNFKQVRILIYYGLKSLDHKLTLDGVGDILDSAINDETTLDDICTIFQVEFFISIGQGKAVKDFLKVDENEEVEEEEKNA